MLKEIDSAQADALLKSMVIPPRPAILLQLEQEQMREEPDFAAIAQLISSDLTLSAAVLKTVNSPFFNLNNRVSSVYQALQLLGLRNLGNIVRGVLLRQALSPEGEAKMERFWLNSLRVALVSAKLSEHIHGMAADEAYTYGLFQDCGMPLMQARFSSYRATLDKCEGVSLDKALEIEEQRHQTNHAVVGYLLGRTWFLPDHINLAILNHQHINIFDSPEDSHWHQVCSLIAVAGLAGHVVRKHFIQPPIRDWRLIEPVFLRHLGMERSEYEDLTDQINRFLDAV